MEDEVQAAQVIRFESFEVNLRSGELLKNGEKLKLPEQSFQILAMLLERPGQVVLRREIQKRLWPNDTVVEFENSINAAIMKLRLALGDSADQPRYVETLARRGYRWMSPVDWAEVQDVRAGSPGHLPARGRPSGAPLRVANLIGKRVSHYRVLEILGGGGMGVVYEGSAPYMSPEQVRGEKLDARTDLFSFGLVLYEMATGQQAFRGETAGMLRGAIVNDAPVSARESNPDLPPKLEEIMNKALEKERGLRYQTAAELRADLKQLKHDIDSGRYSVGADLSAADNAPPGGLPQGLPLRRWRLALGGATLIIAGALALLFRPTLPPPRVRGSTQITRDGRDKEPMVTDGSRIFFSSFSGSNSSLYQLSAVGGETVPVQTSISSPAVLDISPDRSELLVCSFPGLLEECDPWVLPVLGGSPRRVGDIRGTGFVSAVWSRDGKEIVYAQGNSLYRAKADGTESRKIVSMTTSATPFWLRWSPERTRLRFSAGTQVSDLSLWEVSADGRNLHQLFPGWTKPECCGNWTPDGKYFVFQAGWGGTANIWAIREEKGLLRKDSRQPVQLTNGPTSAQFPLPSTDGKKVFVTTTQLRGELVRYDLAFHQFTPYLRGMSATCVNFSRDGKWATYVAYPEGTLWRSKMDGSERLQLTFPPLDVVQPRWSPDGTRIAFQGQQPGKPSRVYVISAEGGSLEEPLGEDHPGADPNWSPDGESLLFARPLEDETPGVGTLELEIVDLRTRAVSKVPGSEELWSPRWSLDGRHILAFPRAADRLMLLDVKNQRWTELAKINIGGPEWSREGDYIYFLSAPPAGQHSGIFRVRISDRKLERVAGLEDFAKPLALEDGWAWPLTILCFSFVTRAPRISMPSIGTHLDAVVGVSDLELLASCTAVYNSTLETLTMKTLTFTEFRKNASHILDLVEKGERIRVLRHGRAIAKIVPADLREPQPAWKRPGLHLVTAGASLARAVLEERRSSR